MKYYNAHKEEILQKKKLYYQSLPIEEKQRRAHYSTYKPSSMLKSGEKVPEDMRSPQLRYYYNKKDKIISS